MSGEVVNLRRARKARQRTERELAADENRRRHGRSKAEKQADATARHKAERHVDGHKRDPGT
jgi:hypothetical protein